MKREKKVALRKVSPQKELLCTKIQNKKID
jgi:hypothetical protein